ncbi:VOC family protein [Mucilaginibacter sp. McL0603]|uniref:VOC family protein n=1 Tax=Mucilaginibacter sp. McL0603 TaxID=3415670 RepID=UPI003CF7E100
MENKSLVAINKLQHIGIPVTDLSVSEAFYNRLSFENVMRSDFSFDGDTGICMMMQHKDIIIELYQMPQKQLQEIKARKDGHVDHIAFDVDDIDATFNALKQASFTILEETPVYLPFWKNGCKYFNILGPDGERLEFNQIL